MKFVIWMDDCRKIPRDLTEATLSGAGLSIVAALCMLFLFGMVKVSTSLDFADTMTLCGGFQMLCQQLCH